METERFVATASGRIHCRELGEGPPLLLLHSNGCSVHEYDAVLAALARDYHCIAWDLPSHGDSEPIARHLSIDDYADVTLALMDALQLDRARLCGASVGGFICMAAALRAPQRIISATIVEAALRSEQEWAADWPRIEASFAIPLQSREQVAPRMRALTDATFARWNIDRAKAGGWRMVDVMWAIREYDALAALNQLAAGDARCALIIGSKGPVIAGRARYEQALPHAPLRVLADAGHFPMLDAPEEFVRAVRDGIADCELRHSKDPGGS